MSTVKLKDCVLLRHLAIVSLSFGTACAGLPHFGSDLGKQEIGGVDTRPDYVTVTSYFGYVAPGSEPDEVREGKKVYYVYAWLPAMTPEIGLRLVSPTKGVGEPKGSDFKDATFAANKDTGAHFDPWIRLERCLAAVHPDAITKPCEQWVTLGENDDSAELPANPEGNKYNSLLRVSTSADDSLKALVSGMYRVTLATEKVGEVQGTYLLQLGAPIELPKVALARNPADLARAVSRP